MLRDPLPDGLSWSTMRTELRDHRALVAVGDRREAQVARQAKALQRLTAALGPGIPLRRLPKLRGSLDLEKVRVLAATLAREGT